MAYFGGGIYGGGVYGSEAALTLTVQDTYPERVLAAATGLLDGLVVSITRHPAGSTVETAVRGADEVTMDTDALVKADAEAPMGTLLTYTLTADSLTMDTATETLTLEGGKVALSDAISGNSAEVVVMAWPSKRRNNNTTVFSVGGRYVAVAGQRSGWSGTIDLFVETADAKNNVLDLIANATSGIIQIRQSGGYEGVDCYVSVLTDDEQRWSQDGSDERRIISLDVVEVGPWADTLESSTFDYADLAAFYTGETYADVALEHDTYLDLAVADLS